MTRKTWSLNVSLDRPSRLLGSPRRTQVLLALALLEESYAAELARLLNARLYAVQTILGRLESEGVIVSKLLGRTRRVALNPRYIAHKELHALLWKLGANDDALQRALARRRGRPRRAGKPGG